MPESKSINFREVFRMPWSRCEFRWVRGHIEVYLNGEFLFSADTVHEAEKELESCGDAA